MIAEQARGDWILFLDADWRPLRVEPWTRAITDLFLGKVEVIAYSRDRTIKCVTCGETERKHCAECSACPDRHAYYCSKDR